MNYFELMNVVKGTWVEKHVKLDDESNHWFRCDFIERDFKPDEMLDILQDDLKKIDLYIDDVQLEHDCISGILNWIVD